MSNSIVLHQWEISPFCQKVSRMLKFKGIPFETIDYNGLLGSKVPLLSKVGKLPVVDINGERVQDSTRIARYLDQHFPELPRLYPEDPMQCAYAELWEDWADEVLYFYEVHFRVSDKKAFNQVVEISSEGRPAFEKHLMKPLLKSALGFQVKMQGTGRMAQADIQAEFTRHLKRIELVLNQTGWLVGDQQTIADIAVASQLLEIVRTSQKFGAQILGFANISKWLDNF